ncbi:hypothetical protein CLU79DRAFT_676172, partial [Phycomyces nitens]
KEENFWLVQIKYKSFLTLKLLALFTVCRERDVLSLKLQRIQVISCIKAYRIHNGFNESGGKELPVLTKKRPPILIKYIDSNTESTVNL